MPTQVQIDGVGTVELDDSFKSKSPAEQDSIIQSIASQQSVSARSSGGVPPAVTGQPSWLDRAVASPPGRLLHDAVIGPVAGMVATLPKIAHDVFPLIGSAMDLANTTTTALTPKGSAPPIPVQDIPATAVHNLVEQPYQGALARNRNTPGYPAARARANAMMAATGGSGFMDQVTPGFNPAIAGTFGLFGGGRDASNADADAKTAGQDAYRADHPVLATVANVLGGLTAAPEVAPETIASVHSGPWFPAPSLPKLPQVTQDAATYAGRLMQSAGKTPADLAALPTSKPITAAEGIGKPGEVALGALARREGQTPDALSGLVKARTASAPQRILSDYAAASGINPLAARGDIEGFIDANQKAAAPLYKQAYAANQNIASPALDRILATPAGKSALSQARVDMQNDMSLMGTPDADLMDQAAEGGTQIPTNGVASGMKLRVYDYVKRALDAQISGAYKAGNGNSANILKDLKNSLVSQLDKADVTAAAGPNSLKPEGGLYAQARAKAGEYLSAKKQFEAGQDDILDNNLPALDFNRNYTAMGDADKQAYLGGVANKLFNIQQAGRLKADIFKNPLIQGKLSTVMGPEKAQAFLRNMESEQKMAEFARKQAPNAGSDTARWQQAMQDQDGSSALSMDALQTGHDAIRQGILPAIGNLALRKGKDAVAGYLTRGMAVPVRDEAGRLLMLPPKDLAALLSEASPLPQKALRSPRLTPQSAIPYGLFGSGLAARSRNQ